MTDTIAAVATAEGEGGIAVVRISGADALTVLRAIFSRRGKLVSHRMYHGYIVADGEAVDEVMAAYLKAPRTYTREDSCEIYCHGGSLSGRRVLRAALGAGARLAEPGEFTKRAFLNGRIDLSQAEAVMQLISAKSEVAARAAVRQLQGGASRAVKPVIERLTGLLSTIEASDDFPDEIEEDAGKGAVREGALAAIAELQAMIDPRGARILREGASVVLAGRPNVGKSSVLNALLGSDRAIVADIPGTTRDVVTERMEIAGRLIELSDTAGLRETGDQVEKIGVARAKGAIETADVVLAVLDAHDGLSEEDAELLKSADARYLACVNKLDAGDKIDAEFISKEYTIEAVEVSAKTGAGIDRLKDAIAQRIGGADAPLVAGRHLDIANRAAEALRDAVSTIDAGFPLDVCAVGLTEALAALMELTGESAREAVIDRVFRDFCVGK